MQLFITIFFFINTISFNDSDEKYQSMEINGKSYYFGSFNDVYQKFGDSLVRIDKSLDSRVTINAYLFQQNDTVIKYGGYGFWSDRNFLYYFDLETKEWEYYKTIQKTSLEGSSEGFLNQKGNKTIFYGGVKVDVNNRINLIPSVDIIEFDYGNRELLKKGTLDFPIRSKKLFYQGIESNIFYDKEFIYRVNPFKNKVEVYKKPKVISFIQNVEFDSENDFFIITKTLPKTREEVEIQLDGNFLDTPLETIDLFTKPKKNLSWVLSFLVFLGILYLLKKKRDKSKVHFERNNLVINGERYEFDTNDIRLIQSLINSKEKNFNDVMKIYSNPELSYGHNTRITNESLDHLSIRLKSIFKLENLPIIKVKSKSDRRQKIIVLSKEFLKFKITFKSPLGRKN